MKLRIIYFRQILITAFLVICFQYETFSQKPGINTGNQPYLFVGLCLGPSQSNIINEGILSVSNLISTKKSSFCGSVEVGYLFSDFIGLSSGIGFVSYKTQLTLDTYQNVLNAIDSDNESYELRVTGSGIQEDQKVGFLTVPVSIIVRLPIKRTIGFFLQPGVSLAVPVSRNFKSRGTFTYKGFYAAYNVLFENLSAFGFPTNLISDTEGELDLKPLAFNASVTAGFDFFFQEKIQFAVAACFDRSLSGISKYPSPDSFQLSSAVNQVNSLMGGTSKTTVQSMGLKIVLRYYLK